MHWSILLVDDEPDVREVFAEYLAGLGHRVTAAEGGREAMETVQAGVRFDVALVDWNLPGISGRDVVYGLRLHSPETVVIITTGDVRGPLKDGMAVAGAVDVLVKPFSLRALRDRLENAMATAATFPVEHTVEPAF
jgi:CheY-like chemotaxis protein